MKTDEFLELLREHQEKELLFEYQTDKLVGANYHITEVKNIVVDSVDCGARTDSWNETVVQLWESPAEIGKREYMTSFKALRILKKVNRMKPMDSQAEIRFEYGNETFHTAQLFVNDFETSERQLRLKLAVQKTDCKAKETCGIPETASVVAEACCEPGTNCC